MKKFHSLFHLFLLIIFTVLGICFGFIDTTIGNIYKSSINAQWSEDKSHFWYRNDLAKGYREFVLVDMTKGMRRLAFDHKKLADSLSKFCQNQVEAGIAFLLVVLYSGNSKKPQLFCELLTWKFRLPLF